MVKRRLSIKWSGNILLSTVLSLTASCSTASGPGDVSQVTHVSDAEIESTFRTARELAYDRDFDTEHSEILWAQMDSYLRVAGDHRFASLISRQPPKTRWAIRQYLDLPRIASEYPLTFALLRHYPLQRRSRLNHLTMRWSERRTAVRSICRERRRSVLIRSPERFGVSEGATTSHSTPSCLSRRASPKPHGPAS
jgi:hypothetical protein